MRSDEVVQPARRAPAHRASLTRFVSGLCALAACAAGSHAQPAAAPAPVPTEAFARLPAAATVALSPDGAWIAALVNHGDKTVAVANRLGDGAPPATALMDADNHDVRLTGLRWVSNQRLVVQLEFPSRIGELEMVETRLVAIDRDGSKLLLLTSTDNRRFRQIQSRVVDWLPGDGHHLLLESAQDARDVWPAIYRVDLDTGEREIVQTRRPGTVRWLVDGQHRPRVAVRMEGARQEIRVCDPDGSNWRTAWSFGLFDQDAIEPLGFGADPQQLYLRADHRNRQAVYAVDLRDPALAKRLVLAFDGGDANGALVRDPLSGEAVGIGGGAIGNTSASYWDPRTKALIAAIDRALPDRANHLMQFNADGTRYLVYTAGNGVPGRFMVGDRTKGTLDLVTDQYPQLPDAALVPKRRLTITARDGRAIPIYLTLPAGGEGRALPTVVLPHGGPIGGDGVGFDPLVAFLANRGYAVLQPQFRGSTGQGFEHMSAGLRRWGLEMQDDLTDTVQGLVARGVADPARICIVGASYGGYAALMGGVKTPELYRCIVSIAGVSDLFQLAAKEEHTLNGAAVFERMVGSVRREREQFEATSPKYQAARFAAPVLLVHGSYDRTVPIAQSEAMAEALKATGKPVELLTLAGGDHAMSAQPDRLAFYARLEQFLAQNLGAAPAVTPKAPARPAPTDAGSVPAAE